MSTKRKPYKTSSALVKEQMPPRAENSSSPRSPQQDAASHCRIVVENSINDKDVSHSDEGHTLRVKHAHSEVHTCKGSIGEDVHIAKNCKNEVAERNWQRRNILAAPWRCPCDSL